MTAIHRNWTTAQNICSRLLTIPSTCIPGYITYCNLTYPWNSDICNYYLRLKLSTTIGQWLSHYATWYRHLHQCTHKLYDSWIRVPLQPRRLMQDGAAGADPNRVGGPSNHLLSNDLTTDIVQGRGTATFAQTLKRTAGQGGGDPDKALNQAFRRIRAMSGELALVQSIIDTACELYKKVSQAGIVKGRSIASVVPAVVFIACRKENLPSRSNLNTFSNKHVLQLPLSEEGKIFTALSKHVKSKTSRWIMYCLWSQLAILDYTSHSHIGL